MNTWKMIGYACSASIAASLAVLLVGACVFGFQPESWSESQGRLLGVVGTIGGIGGAVIGFRFALRRRRASS